MVELDNTQRDELFVLIAKHADNNKQMSTIYNSLRRHNIHTIDELRITDLDDIRNFYGVGKTYIRVITKMKEDIGG
jgi:DNA-directed RNA polymerase alpha subunit